MADEIKISELPSAETISSSDIAPIVKDGVTKKVELGEMIQHAFVTNITASTYAIEDNDYFVGINYAGSQSSQIPAATGSGRVLIIKDTSGAASLNNITISPVTGTIDGSSNVIINFNYQSFTLFDGNTGNWSIV
jgi:hypothetical protein